VLEEYGIDVANWGIVLLIGHVLSAAVLLPTATLAASLLQRWKGPVRWRRLWIGGIVAVPVVWLGTLTAHRFSEAPFEILSPILGGWAEGVIVFGWGVFFSNLTLLSAWLFPTAFKPRRP
jgi:uncharacterized membrane protein YfcA